MNIMRKSIHEMSIILIIFIFLTLASCSKDSKESRTIVIKTEAGDVRIDAETADSPAEFERGLMDRSSLGEDSGMLFIFRNDDYRRFWMKSTLIPLDLIFISSDGIIVDIKHDFQPCRTEECEAYMSKQKARYVIEVNAGFAERNSIKEGQAAVI